MPRRALTDRFVKTVAPTDRRAYYHDAQVEGLVLVVERTGNRSWRLYYRHGGRPRWYTIGNARRLGLKDARDEAGRLNARMTLDSTLDIQVELSEARAVGSFEELAKRYVEEKAKPNLKSWRQSQYKIDTYLLPRWKNLQATTIRRADVRRLHSELTAKGSPVAANQAVAQASTVYDWAIKNDLLPAGVVNPASGITYNKTTARERVLTDAEIPLFWAAWEENGLVASRALRMLLLTGQRPGEIAHMRWEHLDRGEHGLTDENGKEYVVEGAWWTLPGDPDGAWPGTKNTQSHRVWLSAPACGALDVLDDDPPTAGFVFPGERKRSFPVDRMSDVMRAAVQATGAEYARPHDLRRTHGTMITSMNFTRDQMNRIQNHKDGGIGSVYDRHGYAHEARVIQEAVGARILALLGRAEVENVVSLNTA